jgi:hypothetical protein
MCVAAIIASPFPAPDVLACKAVTLFSLSPCGYSAFPLMAASFFVTLSATQTTRQGAFIMGLVGHASCLWYPLRHAP